MRDVLELFEALPQEYPQLLERATNRGEQIVFAGADFFTLQPFAVELLHLSPAQVALYPTVEEVPGDDRFLLALNDGQLEYATQVYGEDIRYDFFFQREENSQTRLQAYHNNGHVNAVEVERITRDDQGLPLLYERVDTHVRLTQRYQYQPCGTADGQRWMCDITSESVNPAHDYTCQQRQRVYFADDGYTVDRIESLDNGDILYDRAMNSLSLEELFEQANEAIESRLLAGLGQESLESVEVRCVLFEYSLQGPFPPTLALIQPHEVDDNPEYAPLSWLNAPDAELFSERGLDAVDFHQGCSALFDQLNAQLDALEFESQQELVITFYVEFCRRLMNNPRLATLIRTDDDFFVTARDFEAANELELLERVLPARQWQSMKSTIESHE